MPSTKTRDLGFQTNQASFSSHSEKHQGRAAPSGQTKPKFLLFFYFPLLSVVLVFGQGPSVPARWLPRSLKRAPLPG